MTKSRRTTHGSMGTHVLFRLMTTDINLLGSYFLSIVCVCGGGGGVMTTYINLLGGAGWEGGPEFGIQ